MNGKSAKIWNKAELAVKIVTVVLTLLFGVIMVGGQIMLDNAAAVNYAFNIETSRIETVEGAENEDNYYYKSAFTSVAAVRANARAYVEAIMEEGATLVKNENNALPLAEDARVSLFSTSSVSPIMTGKGSSGNDNLSTAFVDFKTAFEEEGMAVNASLWNWYNDNLRTYGRKTSGTWGSCFSIGDAPWDKIPDAYKADKGYGDAAIFIISRNAGEGRDMASWYGDLIGKAISGVNTNEDLTANNYLALSPNEMSVLRGLKALKGSVYSKIIVVMNSANPVQCDFIDKEEFGIDAMLWCGTLGDTGTYGVADLLVGKANPSGRLSDTFWKYHYKNPVNTNFGMDIYHKGEWGESVNTTWLTQRSRDNSDAAQRKNMQDNSRSTVYAEGIYVGYRYTETRYEDFVTGRANTGEFDYYDTVSYPFGYGLSYTTFKYEDFKMTREQATGNMEDSLYHFTVKVTNTGKKAGKEVVQLYLQKPYTTDDEDHGIEKAAVELVAFEKTKVLEPNESVTVNLTVRERDLTSYDAQNAKTYILDAGDYYFSVGKDAHDAVNNIIAAKANEKKTTYNTVARGNTGTGDRTMTVKTNIGKTDADTYSVSTKAMQNHIKSDSTKITNQFDKTDILYYEGAVYDFRYLTRSDWEGTVKLGFDENGNCLYNQVRVNVTEEMFQDRKEAMNDPLPDNTEYPTYGVNNNPEDAGHLNLIDLRAYADDDGDPTNDKWIEYDNAMWDQLLDQLTWDEYIPFLSNGWRLTEAIPSIAKPQTIDFNGSVGLVTSYNNNSSVNNGFAKKMDDPDLTTRITFYPCNGIAAATFNKDLMEWYGKEWGEESLWSGISGLYGMGINLHRSPYGGRNFEYYSEDPFLMGTIAAQMTKGAATRGHYMYLKHAIMNDQETYRIGGYVWANEQTIREIYLKPFQIAIEEGGATNVMTAEPALGVNWAGSQGYINSVLRDEYGMTGFAVSDYLRDTDGNYMQGLLGGNDLPDGTFGGSDSKNGNEFSGITLTSGHGNVARAMRDATHRILYTVVHSNAMNGFSSNTRVIVLTPAWITAVDAATTVFTVLFALSAAALAAVAIGRPVIELVTKRSKKEEQV